MTMVIPEFTVPIMAALGLQYVLYRDKSKELLKADFKKILYAVGGLMLLLIIMYMMMSYSARRIIKFPVVYRKWRRAMRSAERSLPE